MISDRSLDYKRRRVPTEMLPENYPRYMPQRWLLTDCRKRKDMGKRSGLAFDPTLVILIGIYFAPRSKNIQKYPTRFSMFKEKTVKKED